MILNRNIDGKIAKQYKNKDIYYLRYSCSNDIVQLKHYLYHNADFYLKRKSSKLP